MGLPDLRTKKKAKGKLKQKQKQKLTVTKESHVTEALDKLREQTREAVKGLDSVTSSKPLAQDLPNDAIMEDWVKQFEELAASQVPLPLPPLSFFPLQPFVQFNFFAFNFSYFLVGTVANALDSTYKDSLICYGQIRY